MLVLVAPVAAQQAPQPFPKAAAKWSVRGKARADKPLLPRLLDAPRANRARFKAPHPDGRRLCNPIDLTLPNVFIEVRGVEKRWRFDPPRARREIQAKDGKIVPSVAGVLVEQAFHVAGGDPDMNLSIRAEASSGLEFADLAFKSKAVGVLRFKCRACPWTGLTVHVVAHPIFATTDAHGRFRLPPLPDGDYELVAIHDVLGRMTQRVTINGANPKPVTFKFRVEDRHNESAVAARRRTEKRVAEIRALRTKIGTIVRDLEAARAKQGDERTADLAKLLKKLDALRKRVRK